MFVTSRKHGERIMIGDDIIITVVDLLKNRVRIGIDAPSELVIRVEGAEPQPIRFRQKMFLLPGECYATQSRQPSNPEVADHQRMEQEG